MLVVRLALVAGAVAVGFLWIVLATQVPGRHRRRRGAWAMHGASRLLLCALRIRLAQRAGPRSGASLVVANSNSWLELLVLSAAGPSLPVANVEVAGWPLIGSLAGRTGTIFINRNRLSGLPLEVAQMTTALRRGERVLMFPAAADSSESTGSPFRRAAFQAAVDAAVVVSPVAVSYRDADGNPTTLAALVDGSSLFTVLIRLLSQRATAEVAWLPVIPAIVTGGHPTADRARAAAAAQRAIDRTLQHPAAGGTAAPTTIDQSRATPSAGTAEATPSLAPAPRAA